MPIAKDLRAKRAKLIMDAKALVNKDGATPEDMARFDQMMVDADNLEAQITRIERQDALEASLAVEIRQAADDRGLSADQIADERQRERRMMVAYLAGTTAALSDADRSIFQARIAAAGSAGSAAGGGYTVAPSFMRELLVAQKAFGGMRGAARIISTDTGVDLPWPTMDDTANVATIVAENTVGVVGTDLVFGQRVLKCWTYRSGYLPLSIELLQDSAFDFDALIRDALATRFARGQNIHFTTGDGVTQPYGIAVAGPVGVTGAAGTATSIAFDDLVNLEHAVDPAYRSGAAFMMADSTFREIKKLKDKQDRPLFLPGYTVGAPDTILGYPVKINQDFPVMAAGAKSIAFGDFNNYIIRDVLSLRITRLNERFAENAQIAFIGFQRTDGRLVSAAAPIQFYKNGPAS